MDYTLSEFLAHAIALEREAAERYLERVETLVTAMLLTNRERLEATLYGNAYKGITDLVTKWLWPRPAMHGVRLCARLGLSPNMVTGFGLALMLATSVLFLNGYYVWGLLLGWLMTYLDTVDGKLARVTVQSSRIGHALDHGMDAIHPPFWYAFWGLSLAHVDSGFGLELADYLGLVIGGYVAGRVAEGAFERLLADQPRDQVVEGRQPRASERRNEVAVRRVIVPHSILPIPGTKRPVAAA